MTKTFLDPIYQTMIGFENLMNRTHAAYPPYNIVKEEDEYTLEIAVSGFQRQELEVSLAGNTLTVKGTKEPVEDDRVYLVRHLAHRSWTRTWTLEPDISVKSVALQDGILTITLVPQPTKTQKVLPIL